MDSVGVTALIIAITNSIVLLLKELHIRKCHSVLCDSDCVKSPPPTPAASASVLAPSIQSTGC